MSDSQSAPTISIEQFAAVALRVGRILRAAPLPAARKPAYQLWIDFGPFGVRQSSAQVTVRYTPESLVGRLVVAVTNLPPRRIAGFQSEVLVLGAVGTAGDVSLLAVDDDIPPGTPIA